MTLLLCLPLGALIGYLRGGRLRNILSQPIRAIWLPIAAFAIEALAPVAVKHLHVPVSAPDGGTGALGAFVLAQYACLIAFFLLNARRAPGAWLAMGAAALNLAAMCANGFRMPVSPAVRDIPALAATAARIDAGELFEYVIVERVTGLSWLGDVLFVPFPTAGMASFGDLLLGTGVCLLIARWMRVPPPDSPAQTA